jgi:hypothetical protein
MATMSLDKQISILVTGTINCIVKTSKILVTLNISWEDKITVTMAMMLPSNHICILATKIQTGQMGELIYRVNTKRTIKSKAEQKKHQGRFLYA